MNIRGIFATFEGVDASGKTTQIKLLRDHIESMGLETVVTREPGGTPLGEKIRQLLLSKNETGMTALTEALLFAAARAQHTAEVIEPSLERGTIVISDRFYDSSAAYQGSGRNMGDTVRIINEKALLGLKPDITFLLYGDPEKLRSRRNHDEEDRLDAESLEFQLRVADGYMRIAKSDPERVKVIDALLPIEKISERVIYETDKLLSERGISAEPQQTAKARQYEERHIQK